MPTFIWNNYKQNNLEISLEKPPYSIVWDFSKYRAPVWGTSKTLLLYDELYKYLIVLFYV